MMHAALPARRSKINWDGRPRSSGKNSATFSRRDRFVPSRPIDTLKGALGAFTTLKRGYRVRFSVVFRAERTLQRVEGVARFSASKASYASACRSRLGGSAGFDCLSPV